MAIAVVASDIYMRALVNETNSSRQCLVMQLRVFSIQLTFARRHTIIPLVINIAGAKSSAVLEPSTTRSATTDSA